MEIKSRTHQDRGAKRHDLTNRIKEDVVLAMCKAYQREEKNVMKVTSKFCNEIKSLIKENHDIQGDTAEYNKWRDNLITTEKEQKAISRFSQKYNISGSDSIHKAIFYTTYSIAAFGTIYNWINDFYSKK